MINMDTSWNGFFLKTAEANKVELTGTLKKCNLCSIVKVKRTPVKHKTDVISTFVGERMYLVKENLR